MARERWIYDHERGEMVQIDADTAPVAQIHIVSDLPEYRSPVTGLPIDGRAARREDLKRHGCREVDPSERNRQRME